VEPRILVSRRWLGNIPATIFPATPAGQGVPIC
jgi:hypothetical protein